MSALWLQLLQNFGEMVGKNGYEIGRRSSTFGVVSLEYSKVQKRFKGNQGFNLTDFYPSFVSCFFELYSP